MCRAPGADMMSTSLTHQGDEFVLELVVQTGDHHLHSVSDLPDPLVLRSPHGLDVSLLTQPTDSHQTTTHSASKTSIFRLQPDDGFVCRAVYA